MKGIDLQGLRFGRLVALNPTEGRRRRSVVWKCTCDCGAVALVAADKLHGGVTNSCGCLRTDTHTKHGLSGTPEFNAWVHMRYRCYNRMSNRWHTHGARGISVCPRWLESFENFYADMGAKPSPDHSIEHKCNDGNYEPGNCVWATDTEQAENRRTTILITSSGITKSLKAWCTSLGIPYVRTWKRIYKSNWTLPSALNLPGAHYANNK